VINDGDENIGVGDGWGGAGGSCIREKIFFGQKSCKIRAIFFVNFFGHICKIREFG